MRQIPKARARIPECRGGTDHTREYIPLIVYGKGISPQMLGTRSTYADIAATAAAAFGVSLDTPGTDFFEKIKR